MKLSERQHQILKGLNLGTNFYVSASEMSEWQYLIDSELVKGWRTHSGAPMWCILPAGRALLEGE